MILFIPVTYLIGSLILTYIPVNNDQILDEKKHKIYLSSNGIHLEIIIHKDELHPSILEGLTHTNQEQFFSFGWGDRTFYMKTSTWSDLSIINTCKAAFFNTPALLHITRYNTIKNDWVEITITPNQFEKLNNYINDTFKVDDQNMKIIVSGLNYNTYDNFYEATGSYNCFNTCNTWVNTALKKSDIKACSWTPYDFRLLAMHTK